MEKCFTPSSASFDCDCAAVFAASKNSVDKLSASSDGPAHSIVPVADVIGPSLVAKGLRLLRGEFACVAATLVAVCLAPTDRCKWRGVEADTGLWRPGDIRAAPRLFAIIREFLLGDVRPVAALAPDVVVAQVTVTRATLLGLKWLKANPLHKHETWALTGPLLKGWLQGQGHLHCNWGSKQEVGHEAQNLPGMSAAHSDALGVYRTCLMPRSAASSSDRAAATRCCSSGGITLVIREVVSCDLPHRSSKCVDLQSLLQTEGCILQLSLQRAAHFLRISSMLCLARMSIGDSPCNISVVAAA
eukprot:CAMPEP_0172849308 /NCGR_PEP_ID=MMETSP1075-20121228/46350_1 /TAXON_ID=2916 /ORGANISM="Ceratium fusus, Strain PA161109" /LENGTH=301 /DNA_ID=CAMNT_0013694861 /DNA_START=97 /DNA_END=1002 /DNA_ORIENTATION=-